MSLDGSDSAEEVAWLPHQNTAEVPADAKASSRQDTSAAIDLLILNYKDSSCGAPLPGRGRPSVVPPLFTQATAEQSLPGRGSHGPYFTPASTGQ